MSYKLGVIGFGNIAQAIITPLLDNDIINPENVICLVKTKESLDFLKKTYKYKINIYQSNSDQAHALCDCPYKLLAVKPQQIDEISHFSGKINQSSTLISIVAGVSINNLQERFPSHECVRAITNIPITIGKGLTGLAWGNLIDQDRKEFVKKIFNKSSKIYEFNEEYLDIFLALTSSATAIIALIIESLSDGGVSGGLNKKLSEELAIEMMLATVLLLKEAEMSTSKLKNMVTSPAGTTISALRILEKNGVRSSLIESIIAAYKRSKDFS